MDLFSVIRQLHEERDRLNRLIEALEKRCAASPVPLPSPRRGGRKAMSQEERMEVSARMRQYWARRRRKDTGPPQPQTTILAGT